MSLTLYFHPLSSFCHKVLIGLYENDPAFEGELVRLDDEASRKAFFELWPIGKMPVLRDGARACAVAETSIILEYLDVHYPGATRFLPEDKDLARQARFFDRLF